MGDTAAQEALRAATVEALRAGGMDLLDRPKAFFGTLADLMPTNTPLMRVLSNVLSKAGDEACGRELSKLTATSSTRDVEAAASRIAHHLVEQYVVERNVADDCARALAEGVAQVLGVSVTTAPEGFDIPAYHRNVSVEESVLRAGGSVMAYVKPKGYDPSEGPYDIASLPYARVNVPVRAGTAKGTVVSVPGEGYYAPDGRRGELRVRLREKKPDDTARKAEEARRAEAERRAEEAARKAEEAARAAQTQAGIKAPGQQSGCLGMVASALALLVVVGLGQFVLVFAIEAGVFPYVLAVAVVVGIIAAIKSKVNGSS
jgi:hypothetical protein